MVACILGAISGSTYATFVDVTRSIVSRGDLLGNLANIKVEINSAVGYVGSSLTLHNPSVFVYRL